MFAYRRHSQGVSPFFSPGRHLNPARASPCPNHPCRLSEVYSRLEHPWTPIYFSCFQICRRQLITDVVEFAVFNAFFSGPSLNWKAASLPYPPAWVAKDWVSSFFLGSRAFTKGQICGFGVRYGSPCLLRPFVVALRLEVFCWVVASL